VLIGYPKLRDDLVISRQETPDGPTFVIKDPASRRFFRFGETEHLIATQFDGATALTAVQARLRSEFDVEAGAETLRQFADQLRRLGLLQAADPSVPAAGTQKKRRLFSGNPLYIRVRAIDPDQFFDRIVGRLAFFFTPWFIALSLGTLATALAITISDWNEILRDLSHLYRFDALLLAWITVLTVTTAHEFAHGLTCKHFGGEVHEIGFLLLYFQPAFYCNVSDAWLFPKKSHRLWVTFAGAYLEIFVWSVATIVWRVTEPDTWVSFVAMIVMATSGIKSLFNMNPLIKLDGYYLLSDYLEVPNLRQRSTSYVKGLVRRLWRWSIDSDARVTPRERRIYVIYGLLAMAYSFWILSLVAVRFGSYMVERYQGTGFIAFSLLLGAAFQRPLGSAARTLRNVATFPQPSRIPKIRPQVARAVALAAAAALLFLGRMELKVSGEFKVFPARNADVRAMVDGLVEQVYVEEGQHVRAGDVLVRLSERDYRAELGKVDADIAEKRATLKMLRAGPRREEIELARQEVQTAVTRRDGAERRFAEAGRIRATRLTKSEAAVRAAEEQLQFKRAELRRFTELFASGLVPSKQLEESQHDVALQEKALETAHAELETVSADDLGETREHLAVSRKQADEAGGKLKLLMAGSRPEAIEATEAAIARLEQEQRFLTEQLRLTAIISPTTGVVGAAMLPRPSNPSTPAVVIPRLKEKIGEQVNKGDPIARVFELDRITAEVTVPEKEIADVTPGQRVVLKARAFPDKAVNGTVKTIAPAANDDNELGRKVFRVTIEMDGDSALLKPEMTGTAKIFCGTRSVWGLLTRRIERYLRVEFWSWW
jgi:putative peptide zinc metalloprotease protein